MQRILGNTYGQLIYGNKWSSEKEDGSSFRFCYSDHKHPEKPTLLTGGSHLLCHYPLTGEIEIAETNAEAQYINTNTLLESFCQVIS